MTAVPMSVLIVDDHARFRARARRLLEAEGYAIVGEAQDGASGLAAAEELRPDVVLLDVHLPVSVPSSPAASPSAERPATCSRGSR